VLFDIVQTYCFSRSVSRLWPFNFLTLAFVFQMANFAIMTTTPEHDRRIAEMTFASVYPHYLAKVEKKGRSQEELQQVIEWLTGFDAQRQKAKLNPNAHLITGVICGYRIEEIETRLTRQARYLDKLVDELAKGRKMEKILRQASSH
jgi:hypothetical protein